MQQLSKKRTRNPHGSISRTVALSKDMYDWIEAFAIREKMNFSEAIREILYPMFIRTSRALKEEEEINRDKEYRHMKLKRDSFELHILKERHKSKPDYSMIDAFTNNIEEIDTWLEEHKSWKW